MCEFRRTLDFVEDLEAAAEGGAGLGSIAHGFMDLSQNTMSRDFFETEGPSLRGVKRLTNGDKGFVVMTGGQVELSACDLRVWDREG